MHQGLQQTRLASSLNGRHSPNALTKVVIFFFGSALASASIIGLRGLEKKRIICQIKSPGLILQLKFLLYQENASQHITCCRTIKIKRGGNLQVLTQPQTKQWLRKTSHNLRPNWWVRRSRIIFISFHIPIRITIMWNNMVKFHSGRNYLDNDMAF